MLKNYFITALRSINRNRVHTFINLIGLSFSLACCIVIYVLIRYEHSFDSDMQDEDRIYRVVAHTQTPDGMMRNGSASFPLAAAVRQETTGVESAVNIFMDRNATIKVVDKAGQAKLFEERTMAYAESELLSVFEFPVLAGNPQQFLQQPNEVVLTHSLAEKIFGQAAPDELIGQVISVNQADYQVSGILADIPKNSNVYCTIILPFQVFQQENPMWSNSWKSLPGQNNAFVKLKNGASPDDFEAQLASFSPKYLDEALASQRSFHLQALSDVHTNAEYGGTLYTTPHKLIIALMTMGIIILLTACINFINMSTAQALQRAKEVGIRKAMGSTQWQITWQLVFETLMVVLLATVFSVLLSDYFFAGINRYLAAFSEFIHFDLSPDHTLLFFLLGIVLVVTLVAGLYPARVIAAYRPAVALKQSLIAKASGSHSRFSLRKALVVAQFIMSQLLIIGTLVITMQLDYFRQYDVGFAKDQILNIEIPPGSPKNATLLQERLEEQAAVTGVSLYSNPPTSIGNNTGQIANAGVLDDQKYTALNKSVDTHYLDLFEIQLLAGRNLLPSDHHSDSVQIEQVILNETATKLLGYKKPDAAVGQVVMIDGAAAAVVGVVADFANKSLQDKPMPCFLHYGDNVYFVGAKLSGQHTPQVLADIQQSWQEVYPDEVYRAKFMNDYLAILYTLEDMMYRLIRIAAALAIVIGCMGLYGLVSYLSLQKRKEIGIRKTLGATVGKIVYLFSKEFTLLVVLAFVVAAPLGYLIMEQWLQGFAHRTELQWWYFALGLLASVFIAGLTVGYKSIKAAIANPVDSLRSE